MGLVRFIGSALLAIIIALGAPIWINLNRFYYHVKYPNTLTNAVELSHKPEAAQSKWKPITAGVINILLGILTILLGLFYSMFVPSLIQLVITLLFIPLLGITAIVGGYFAIRKRRWRISLLGAICVIIVPLSLALLDSTGLGFFVTVALIGMLAVAFIVMSRRDFIY